MSRFGILPMALSIVLGMAGAACAPAATLPAPSTSTTSSSAAPIPSDPGGDAASLAQARLRLAEHRKVQIERLREYRMRGVFPRNRVSPRKANIFIDETGTLCAVANLAWQDGLQDAVTRASRQNNFVRVADLESGALHDWMLGSGLTREEVALIQEPYMPMQGEANAAWMNTEDQRLTDHFVAVEQRLVEDTNRSLDIALSRLRTERAVATGRRGPGPADMAFATPPDAW